MQLRNEAAVQLFTLGYLRVMGYAHAWKACSACVSVQCLVLVSDNELCYDVINIQT